MSNGQKKDQSQENWQRVRALLNEHWDPLGVADQVDDEYDHYVDYVDAICQMLMDRQVSEAAISFTSSQPHAWA
jgi:hypothetical protein